MNSKINITVLIATYNRAESIKKTLDSFIGVDTDDISAEIVVVDNASTDNTKETIMSFADKLPLTYFYQATPGKNHALNLALENTQLGELVAFTDDDVLLPQTWFRDMMAAAEEFPDYQVFGGRVKADFSDVAEIPKWFFCKPKFGGADLIEHDLGDERLDYWQAHRNSNPIGANFWVRRCIFDNGRRFNPNIGPSQNSKTQGSETSFLMGLSADGYKAIYLPDVIVKHRLQQSEVYFHAQWKRQAKGGRGMAMLKPFGDPFAWENDKLQWLKHRLVNLSICAVAPLAGLASCRLNQFIASLLAIAPRFAYEKAIWKNIIKYVIFRRRP